MTGDSALVDQLRERLLRLTVAQLVRRAQMYLEAHYFEPPVSEAVSRVVQQFNRGEAVPYESMRAVAGYIAHVDAVEEE